MSHAKVRVFARIEDEQNAVPVEVRPDEGAAFYIRVYHPQGGSRLISVVLGPRGGIEITRGVKLR